MMADLEMDSLYFRDIVMCMADWVWEVDAEGKYVYCSDRVADILGYTKEEMIGKTPFDFMPEDKAPDIAERFKSITAAKANIDGLENWNIHKKGHPVCLLTNGHPIIDKQGKLTGYRGVDRDITESKLAKEELVRSRERMQLALDGAKLAYWDWDIESTRNHFSPEWYTMLGYEPDEMPQTYDTWISLLKPDTVSSAKAEIKRQLLSSMIDVIFQMRHKNGQYRWINTKGRVFSRDGEGNPLRISGTNQDITETVKNRLAMEENEQFLSAVYQNSDVGFFVTKVSDDGQLVYEGLNPVQEELTGIKNEVAKGKTIDELAPHLGSETVAIVKELYNKCIESRRTLVSEFYVPEGEAKGWWHSHRTPITDKETGRVTRIIGSALNITERKRIEEQLAWELKVSEMAGELSNAILDSYKSLRDTARHVLASARELTGAEHGYVSEIDISTNEIIVHAFTAMNRDQCSVDTIGPRLDLKPEDAGTLPRTWGHPVGSGEPYIANDLRESKNFERLPEGHLPIEKFLSVPIYLGEETVGQIALANPPGDFKEKHLAAIVRLGELYAIAINEDRNTSYRLQLEEQLRQTQKLEAVGTLAGGIAHDFNNILGAIQGYTELNLDLAEDGTDTKDNLKEILQAARRAKELVKQILTFSRKARKTLEPVHAHLVVGEAMRLLRKTIPATIEFKVDISKKDDTVLADPTQLHQIVMNLCTNSYHAMRGEGGLLRVTLEPVMLDKAQARRINGLKEGSYVRLTVDDTGEGIPPEVMSKIFEPFFTTKAQSEGTGMGLAVVHGIVKNHGGGITIESALGKGTKVAVYLPQHASMKSLEAKPSVDAALARGNERLLIVDDEIPLSVMMGKMLKNLGYSVEIVNSSTEALELLAKNIYEYDLLITDQAMPKLSGDKLAGEALKIRPDMPIIMCTGFSETVNENNAASIGLKDLLMKPVSVEALAMSVRGVLDGKISLKPGD